MNRQYQLRETAARPRMKALPRMTASPARRLWLPAAALGCAVMLAACAGEVNRHGALFGEVDLDQIQTGMSQDQVRAMLGTPTTTSTADGNAYYYISSTSRTRPMGRPQVVDRQIVAVYFDENSAVSEVANYGLKDGRVFNFVSNETPSRGREVSLLEQMFGNLGARREMARQQSQQGGSPVLRPDEAHNY